MYEFKKKKILRIKFKGCGSVRKRAVTFLLRKKL